MITFLYKKNTGRFLKILIYKTVLLTNYYFKYGRIILMHVESSLATL